MGSYAAVVVAVVMMMLASAATPTETAAATPSLASECGAAIEKVTSCLAYATGKAVEPTGDCCSAVSGMKEKQPVCLCFFIGQAHNGSQQIKSLGIQEPKLLQLPNACHLANVSISNCPKLLGISPSSPAAAIFVNNNATSPSSSSSSTATTTTASGGDNKSSGFKHGICGFLLLFSLSSIFLA